MTIQGPTELAEETLFYITPDAGAQVERDPRASAGPSASVACEKPSVDPRSVGYPFPAIANR